MDVVKKKKIGKYLIEIVHDIEPINPRVDYDNLCVMACFHSRYRLGDQERRVSWSNTSEGMREFQKWFNEHKDEVIYKPLNLYDHSGLTISTSSEYPYNDRWDSSSVGVIYVEKVKILKEFGLKEWGPEAEEKANDVIDAEVKTYDYYLKGCVYGYKITDTKKGEEIESCWGFLGDSNYCLQEAESLTESLIEADKEWEAKAKVSARYLHVRVEIRHSSEIDPDEVINECDYSFVSQTNNAEILDTEIQEQQEEPF